MRMQATSAGRAARRTLQNAEEIHAQSCMFNRCYVASSLEPVPSEQPSAAPYSRRNTQAAPSRQTRRSRSIAECDCNRCISIGDQCSVRKLTISTPPFLFATWMSTGSFICSLASWVLSATWKVMVIDGMPALAIA